MNWWSHQTEILPFFTLQLSFVAPPFHTQPQRRRLEQPMAVWKMRTLQSKMPIGNDTLCNHMSLFHDLFIQNISKLFKTNTIHYTSMHENTLTEACIDLHCFLMRAFFFYGYFQLPRSISHSLQPMYFLYDWVLSYVPTVWRGPASQSRQPLLGFATKLFPPRVIYRKYRHAIGNDRIHWLVRPARTQGQLNTNHHLFLSSDTAALMYNHSFK